MFLLLYTRKIEHIMQYVEIVFIFHFCQTSNFYISLKQYYLSVSFCVERLPLTTVLQRTRFWAPFAASFRVISCVLNSVSVSRLQMLLGFSYPFIALWVPGQRLMCDAGYLLPQGVHVESNRPYFVLFVCLLAPFSSSSNRFQSLRDFIGHLMLRMRVDLLESCFVHFS